MERRSETTALKLVLQQVFCINRKKNSICTDKSEDLLWQVSTNIQRKLIIVLVIHIAIWVTSQ